MRAMGAASAGSEYQTQFVVDGIPLTDNRSPSFGPEIEADDLSSVSIYTAGIPAEYGRKMGGVWSEHAAGDGRGVHGQLCCREGATTRRRLMGRCRTCGAEHAGASASGSMSAHYLNPVVPENYTNRGTTGDFAANYERDLTQNDR